MTSNILYETPIPPKRKVLPFLESNPRHPIASFQR